MKIKTGKSEASPYEVGTQIALPLNLIRNHGKVVYRPIDKKFVEELSASIESRGLDTPLVVWNGGSENVKMKAEGELHPATFLLAGQHRRAALNDLLERNEKRFNELFAEGVPCRMRGDEDLNEAIAAQVRENLMRKNPSAAELLPFMEAMREGGMKDGQIAKAIGKHKSYVSELFDIEDELGKEAADEVKKGGVSVKDALKAKNAVKDAKREGKTPDVKGEVDKAKKKTADRNASGRERDEKRVSAKSLWKRVKALPPINLGKKVNILMDALAYLAGEVDELPKEVRPVADKKK